mgnify:CR=1 FL=1
MIAYCQQAYGAYKEKGGCRRDGNACIQSDEHPVEKSACHTCCGIDLFVKDDGHVVEQHVAYHASCRPRHATHDDGDPSRGVRMLQSSGYQRSRRAPGPRCRRQTRCCRSSVYACRSKPRTQCCKGANHVDGGGHPEGCRSQHYVAERTSSYRHGKSADISSEPVEMLGSCVTNARNGESNVPSTSNTCCTAWTNAGSEVEMLVNDIDGVPFNECFDVGHTDVHQPLTRLDGSPCHMRCEVGVRFAQQRIGDMGGSSAVTSAQ